MRSWGTGHLTTMRHNLPPGPTFQNATATDPIQEFALRFVVERPGWKLDVIGTATLIGANLALTARHVLEAAIAQFGATQTPAGIEVSKFSIKLYQVLPGPVYRFWAVTSAWVCDTDIAILHLQLDSTSEGASTEFRWRSL
jgi:hypothetical protein